MQISKVTHCSFNACFLTNEGPNYENIIIFYFYFSNREEKKAIILSICIFQITKLIKEAVPWRCSVTKVFLKNPQNSQENACATFFLIKLQASALQLY